VFHYPILLHKEKEIIKNFIYDEIPGLLNHRLAWRHNGDICEDCLYRFKFIDLMRRRMNCCYCGRLLCSICCTKESVLPAQIIEHGDFDTHPVCNECEAHISANIGSPMINFTRLSVTAIKSIGIQKIDKIKRLRADMVKYLYLQILPECNSRNFLVSLIPIKLSSFLEPSIQELQELGLAHDSNDTQKNKWAPLISLRELLEIKMGTSFETLLETLQNLLLNHTKFCLYCKNVK